MANAQGRCDLSCDRARRFRILFPPWLPLSREDIRFRSRSCRTPSGPVIATSRPAANSHVIPAGTDVVALQLESDPYRAKLATGRPVIRTVAGTEVWRGPAAPAADLPAGVVVRVDVPAARLSVD